MNTRRYSFAGIPLIAIEGDLETASVWRLASLMLECLAPRGERLVFDLTGCPYRQSEGIGLLLRLLFDVVDGCWVAIVGANGPLSRVFDLTGLSAHRNFFSYADLQELGRALGAEDTDAPGDGVANAGPRLVETEALPWRRSLDAEPDQDGWVGRTLSLPLRPAWAAR